VLYGAEQEHGLLPGTENVALIVAMGAAAAVASASLLALSDRLRSLRDRLHAHLEAGVPEIRLNGDPERRLPNTLHVSFPGASGRAFLASVSNTVAASVGSACHSEQDVVSGVPAAMGLGATRANGAVRLSVGRETRPEHIDLAATALLAAWTRLTSP
jgi:cysteine desulfurase